MSVVVSFQRKRDKIQCMHIQIFKKMKTVHDHIYAYMYMYTVYHVCLSKKVSMYVLIEAALHIITILITWITEKKLKTGTNKQHTSTD